MKKIYSFVIATVLFVAMLRLQGFDYVVADVAVGQHDPLGIAGRPGGIDDDGQFVRGIFGGKREIRAHVTGDSTARIVTVKNRKARHDIVVGIPDDAIAAEDRERNAVAFLMTQERFLQAKYRKGRL